MDRGIVPSDIYKILAAPTYDFTISMYDAGGEGTISPINAKWFYVKPLNFMIQVPNGTDPLIRPEVYLWKSIEIRDEQTKEILNRLKNCANQYGYGFTINDFSNGNLPKKFSHIAMRNVEETQLQESFTGSSLRSYYKLPKAKAIIVHSTKINEDSERTSNIKEIFIDSMGERFRLKTPNIDAAKALTLHMNENGSWNDKYSSHIENTAKDLVALTELLPSLSNHPILRKKAQSYISELTKSLKNSSSPKGYSYDIANIRSVPRIGKQFIENFARRLGDFPPELSNSLSRQFLIRECSRMHEYASIIYDNIDMSNRPNLNKRDIITLAKKLCLGALELEDSLQEPLHIGTDNLSPREKVLMFGSAIAGLVKNDIIKEVLENLCSKPYLEEKEGHFINAAGNSALGKYRKGFTFGGSAPSASDGSGSSGAASESNEINSSENELMEDVDSDVIDLKKWIDKQ